MAHFGDEEYRRSNENASAILCVCIGLRNMWQSGGVVAPLWLRAKWVLPPLSVGEMTLRLYAALNYSQNSAHDLRRALNGA